MAKTRRKKINKSPGHPFAGRAKAFVIDKGDMVTTRGIRGRTKTIRIENQAGKRVGRVRTVEVATQLPPPAKKAKGIFVGRVYTGVSRSKPYPYGSTRQGFPKPAAPVPKGLLAGAGRKAMSMMKRVVTGKEA